MLDIVSNVAPLKPTETIQRQLSWLSEHIERGRREPFAEIVAITPEIARRLLELNESNRGINQKLLAEITDDIEKGNWELNGETIIISKDGYLNNGQHRLLAIVTTGKTLRTLVFFGATRESRMTVDMGRPRSAGNFLAMAGVKNAFNSAAISRLLILYEAGIYEGVRAGYQSPTKQAIRKYYDAHRKEIEGAIEAVKGEKFSRLIGTTPLCAAHVIIHRLTQEGAAVFFCQLLSGSDGNKALSKTNPIIWLRSRFMVKKVDLRSFERLESILRYWNAWRSEQQLHGPIPRKGSYPKVQS